MNIFGQIILGLLIITAGVMTLIKNYQVANTIPLRWFEQKMGSGSSYTLWKVFSVVMVFAGLTIMFGFGDNLMGWLLSPVTNMVNPGADL
jgi:hypothetical protein